jgi:hypothetical protein
LNWEAAKVDGNAFALIWLMEVSEMGIPLNSLFDMDTGVTLWGRVSLRLLLSVEAYIIFAVG